MSTPHIHASHPQIRSRLARARGHLDAILRMMDEGRPCPELAQQLQAVEKALTNAKRALIHDHIDHCLTPDHGPAEEQLQELRNISRYL